MSKGMSGEVATEEKGEINGRGEVASALGKAERSWLIWRGKLEVSAEISGWNFEISLSVFLHGTLEILNFDELFFVFLSLFFVRSTFIFVGSSLEI